MVALLRVGDGPAGQESASQKGRLGALFLQDAVVDVVEEQAFGVGAEGVHHPGDLLRVAAHESPPS